MKRNESVLVYAVTGLLLIILIGLVLDLTIRSILRQTLKRRSGRTTQDLHRKIWYGLHNPLRFVGDSIGLAPRIGVG